MNFMLTDKYFVYICTIKEGNHESVTTCKARPDHQHVS